MDRVLRKIGRVFHRRSQVAPGEAGGHGKEKKPRFIAISSGKGGVGKTTLAANLGVALCSLGKGAAVVDLDIAMPNLEVLTGVKPSVGLKDVLEGTIALEKAVYYGPGGVKALPPGLMLEGYSGGNAGKIKALLENFPPGEDFVLLDMPPGREATGALPLEAESLLVVNPKRSSVLDALNMKVILEGEGFETLGVVLNRARNPEGWIEEIEEVLESKVVGVIPESSVVEEAFEEEECLVASDPRSAVSREIMELAGEL